MATMDADAADRLLAKLRRFAEEDLDTEERALLARLLAPGVALAFEESEVDGFQMVEWPEDDLGSALADALRRSNLRVEGLHD
ncbi:MAG: hypothetical protein WD271_09945 [Acidimicrobiia bacterium]